MTVGVDAPTAEQWAKVEANRGLVFMHVNQMRHLDPEDREDAVQDGMFGLLRAVQKYDPSSGCTFSTYAKAWILNSVRRGIGKARGRNYRRAVVAGDEWVRPAGLDAVAEVASGDTADGSVVFSAAIEAMRARCHDPLDHAIVDWFASGDSSYGSRAGIAARFGVSPETVRLRRLRLARFARLVLAA